METHLSDLPTASAPEDRCLYCERTEAEIPLVSWRYRGRTFCLCPEHLPLLIHAPEELASLLGPVGIGRAGFVRPVS